MAFSKGTWWMVWALSMSIIGMACKRKAPIYEPARLDVDSCQGSVKQPVQGARMTVSEPVQQDPIVHAPKKEDNPEILQKQKKASDIVALRNVIADIAFQTEVTASSDLVWHKKYLEGTAALAQVLGEPDAASRLADAAR